MSEGVHEVVGDVLSFLMKITHDHVAPPEALQDLQTLRARHPAMDMELVWEQESYDRSLHYDVLLRAGERATVSVSYCRDRGLPWPLRGVQRWSDANLVQVNGRMLTMEDGALFLETSSNERSNMQCMVDACLIREEVDKRPIEVRDDELQAAMDALRRAHDLHSVDATHQWMQKRGITHEQLERIVAANVTCMKLRKRIAEGRVDGYFHAHRADLDIAHIVQIRLLKRERARHLQEQIASGAMDFFEVAEEHFLATSDVAGFGFSMLRRRDASTELGAAVFSSAPGNVVGPVRVGDSYVICRVLGLRPARQDEATCELIERLIFEDWLAEQRQNAKVIWHWGKASEPA